MADLAPFLEQVELVVRHGYGSVGELRAVEVDVVQLRRNLAEENPHSVRAPEAVAGAADHEDMGRHKGLQAYAVVDCYVVDSCQDDHIGLQQAEARKGRLAYRRERRQQVLHFE